MNINTIKQRLDALNNKNKKVDKVDTKKFFWKPPVGKSQIRILPSKTNSDYPFVDVAVHYGISKFPMMALTNYGEKDPIVELSQKLIASGVTENWKLGKKIEPKTRHYAAVIVRGEEKDGPKLWEFGKELYQELLNIAADEDIGDYTSVTNGRDFTVETVGKEVTGNFNKSSIRVKTKESIISDDAEIVKRALNEQPNVLNIFAKKTYDEMMEILQNYLEPAESEEAEVEETEEEEVTTESPFIDSKTAPKKSNAQAFDELFKK